MPEFIDKVRIEDVIVLKATDKALLCDINDDEIWIPQSQIDDDSEVFQEGDEGTLVISLWIAEQKGLA
jgi:hypothetical protein